MNNKYQTTDFYLAAALRAAGFKDMEIMGTGNIKTFCFKDSDELRNYVDDYWNRSKSAYLPALTLANEIKNLKGMLHAI